jgi:hypothetical protein
MLSYPFFGPLERRWISDGTETFLDNGTISSVRYFKAYLLYPPLLLKYYIARDIEEKDDVSRICIM